MSTEAGGKGSGVGASSGSTGASASVSVGSTDTDAFTPPPWPFTSVPSTHSNWIENDPVIRRKKWVEFLLTYLQHFLGYLEPQNVAYIKANSFTVQSLCVWMRRLRNHYRVAGGN